MDFEQVYNEYFNKIFAYISVRVRSPQEAQDVAAVVWQNVFKNLSSYDAAKGNVSQWLFTIARNQVNSHYRFYHVKKFFSLGETEENIPQADTPIPDALAMEEEKQRLFLAVKDLSRREQDLISLKFYSGLNNRQIASLCNLSEGNVGTILNRSMQKLRTALEVL
ncbi:MAG: sigma-70 family RNA polymerase sigma factor [Elusimicrobium sp.]|jgi:RNA polymerase sigma-70 factor (ECF subfamily)|nr:sigma-70 family RNA polymerase sigma factor [Elusimicrobium sp.]